MTLPALLSDLQRDPGFMANVVAWETIPARAADFSSFSKELHPTLTSALGARGIDRLYSHQALAVEHTLRGENVTVVTPTASGKTLCYNLPVLHTLLTDPSAKALYLFPTKALAQDQLAELHEFRSTIDEQNKNSQFSISQSSIFSTYDGDTPTAHRAAIRKTSRLIITNPDMLHTAILPYHTQWQDFLGGLRYIVIDEMHVYRGVFGSHVANVLRRLRRLCDFYGAHPQVICASATIANPGELAERLTEQPTVLITENGAPRGEKHIVLYNPPIYDQESGLRRSGVLETQDIAARCVLAGVQTITFARSRLTTEVLLTYMRERIRPHRSPRHSPFAIRHSRLPRRLPPLRAPGHRSRAAGWHCAGRGDHQRPGIGHRHRPASGRGAVRLSRHHRQHLAADGPGRAHPRERPGHPGRHGPAPGPVHHPAPGLHLWPLAGTCPDQPGQPDAAGGPSALRRL